MKVKMEGAKGTSIRWLISKPDGAQKFAMRLFEIKPGGYSPLHTHPYEHEVYVIEGKGVLVYEGEEYKFDKNCCIFVPPDKLHQFKNTGKTVLKFLCLILYKL
ncbi:MAG: cupin domain-containing protein [bacterium]|nr:cupin domain-containing protein [bacterium]